MDWIVFFALVFAAASTGAIFKPDTWYRDLRKPSWTPPNGAFPIVWTVLYICIAIAGVLVWRSGALLPLVLWGVQVLLNAAWSWLFFGLKRMDWGMIDVSLLWLAILAFILASWRVSTIAALLFLPYLAWVTAAAALNRSVWRLNPDASATTGQG